MQGHEVKHTFYNLLTITAFLSEVCQGFLHSEATKVRKDLKRLHQILIFLWLPGI